MTGIDDLNLSLAQRIAALPADQREQALDGLDPDDLLHDWRFWARPSQRSPVGKWSTWLYMAGRGCIAAETEIDLADGSRVRVDDACAAGLSLNVLALHDSGKIGPATAEAPFVKGWANIWTVLLEDGRSIAVTDRHRFLTPTGWMDLADLSEDSVIASASREEITWTRIQRIRHRGFEPFYDLHVPGVENYSAHGILHHNSGKTRSASEWIHERVRDGHARRILFLGRTAADVRDVMVGGESGVLNTGRPEERPVYSPSKRLVTWPNGAEALLLSADEPDQARGPQADTAWCDEFASFPAITGADGATAFDNLRMGLRLPVDGDMPRMILTTTPRRVPAMFQILEQAKDPQFGIVITRGTTYENLGNLADSFRATIMGMYEGTRLGRQELMGEMLADIEGALFLQEWFDGNRVDELPPGRMYSVVGVDPSVAERPSDECGIVVVRATMEKDFYRRHLYVVEDASVKGSPSVWAAQVARMSRKWNAPVVAEGNQGGELVRMAIAQADTNLPVHIVHAKTGKATRAEPVAALFEQGRGHMLGWHSVLEDQLGNWIPAESRYSPDRLDALTWACLSLSTRQKGISFALGRHLRARSSRGRLPQITAANLAMKSSGRR